MSQTMELFLIFYNFNIKLETKSPYRSSHWTDRTFLPYGSAIRSVTCPQRLFRKTVILFLYEIWDFHGSDDYIVVFRIRTLYMVVGGYSRFGGIYCLYLHGEKYFCMRFEAITAKIYIAFSGLWHRAVGQVDTNVSQEHAASMCKIGNCRPERWHLPDYTASTEEIGPNGNGLGLIFGRRPVRVKTGIPTIPNEDFRGVSQFLHANYKINC
jgi:hypothetical protein